MADNICTNIIQVFETRFPNETNDRLNLGWILLNTYTTCGDVEGPLVNDQEINYVLGWPSDKGEIKYPPEKKAEKPKYGHVI